MSNPTQPPPFSRQIREGTRKAHTMAETTGFIRGFLRGAFSPESYFRLLADLAHVYGMMESQLDRLADHPSVAPFRFPELYRSDALAADLEFFRPGPNAKAWPGQAARSYAAEVRRIAFERPELLVAHVYTRSMGDLSGGQVLGEIVRRSLDLEPTGPGLAFYRFPGVTDIPAFKREFRARLDALPAAGAPTAEIIAESNRAFAFNTAIFEELEGKALPTFLRQLTFPVRRRLGWLRPLATARIG